MKHTKESLIAFENRIKAAWEAGDLPYLVHLSGGNEEQLLEIFGEVKPGDWVLASHRDHYAALLAGIPEAEVEAMIRAGRSMFLYSREHRMLASAILGGTLGIAVGLAWSMKAQGSGSRVWAFLGDGAEESGRLHECAIYVEGHELPCTFIVEDNCRQVDTPTEVRRGTGQVPGLETIFTCVRRYRYTPTFPHAGSGCAHHIKFNPEIKCAAS